MTRLLLLLLYFIICCCFYFFLFYFSLSLDGINWRGLVGIKRGIKVNECIINYLPALPPPPVFTYVDSIKAIRFTSSFCCCCCSYNLNSIQFGILLVKLSPSTIHLDEGTIEIKQKHKIKTCLWNIIALYRRRVIVRHLPTKTTTTTTTTHDLINCS